MGPHPGGRPGTGTCSSACQSTSRPLLPAAAAATAAVPLDKGRQPLPATPLPCPILQALGSPRDSLEVEHLGAQLSGAWRLGFGGRALPTLKCLPDF